MSNGTRHVYLSSVDMIDRTYIPCMVSITKYWSAVISSCTLSLVTLVEHHNRKKTTLGSNGSVRHLHVAT
jgi:hypothetical protein